MTTARTSDLWWKSAVIYCLDVETFLDWNGDGIGDLVGLTERIDYLAGIGVSCIWLMPFQPSPNRDDGYDITDYYGVDERLGSLGDFVGMIRTAKDRGMRVIVDLVVNHTSDKHPWFRAARSSPNSEFRDYYVWADEPPAEPKAEVVFPDAEDTIWAWDEKAGQYFLHHFYSHQPDLNIANPKVRAEMAKIVGFWLELGVDGFRVDAVPFLLETGGVAGDVELDPHDFLRDLRSFMARRRGDVMMLGEVNLPHKDLQLFFGGPDGDEVQLLFNFILMQSIYLALARQDARPIAKALRDTVRKTDDQQYANFLRNHDELTLDKLTDAERQEIFDAFGPEEDMQLFGRGLRRRLPPMLDGDPQRIRMAYSLLFSLPGTPMMQYGDEIGIGDNLDLPERECARTPMQWTSDPHGGFTRAEKPFRPVNADETYGYEKVNVADQRRDPSSLLNWTERRIRMRKECPEIPWGQYEILRTNAPEVLVMRYDWRGSSLVTLHNFSDRRQRVELDPKVPRGDVLMDVFDENHSRAEPSGAHRIDLPEYAHRWMRVGGADNALNRTLV